MKMKNTPVFLMVNINALSTHKFTVALGYNEAYNLKENGWAKLVLKDFQYRLVDSKLEIQVSKPAEGRLGGSPYHNYNLSTANSMAGYKDMGEIARGARNLFGAFGDDYRVFWRNLGSDCTSYPRYCGVFRRVSQFTPTEDRETHIVSFDLKDDGEREAMAQCCSDEEFGLHATALYPAEAELVYKFVISLHTTPISS